MKSYNLTIVNNSQQRRTFVVYQTYPVFSQSLRSLAWRLQDIPGTAKATIKWDEKYSLVWGQPGSLRPGDAFRTGQDVFVDPQGANQVTFTAKPPSFSHPVKPNKGLPADSLIIFADDTVSLFQFFVGVGMAGSPSVVDSASPKSAYIFPASPSYWVAAVDLRSVREGDVLDTARLSSSSSEVVFDDDHSATYVYTGK